VLAGYRPARTEALDLGADVRAVQRFSRHRNLATLQRYDDNRADLGGQVNIAGQQVNLAR
jgi:hypothetical protein